MKTDTLTFKASEWRNLEPCEIIQDGDEVLSSKNGWIKARRIGQHPLWQGIYRTRKIAHEEDRIKHLEDEVERLTDHLEIKNNKIKALELSLKTFSNWSVTIKQNLLCDPDFIRITKEVLNEDHENEEKLDILREKIK